MAPIHHLSWFGKAYLASSWDLKAINRPGNLNALDLAVFGALVLDILHYLLVLLIIQELLWGHHVHQAQDLGGNTTHLHHGVRHHPRHLQRHWSLIYTCLQTVGKRKKDSLRNNLSHLK